MLFVRNFVRRGSSKVAPMATRPKHPPGPPMTLGNMRHLGVRGLAVHCLNPQCRHQAVFSADDYPDEVPAVIPSADEMPEVWRQGPINRRTAKLERAALKADYAAS